MSYKIEYGFGRQGDISIADGLFTKVNSYVRCMAFKENTVTVDWDTLIEGDFERFHAGDLAVIHISATNRATAEHLGRYLIATITLIQENVITFDKEVADFFSGVNLDYEYAQLITLAQFDCLRLKDGAILAPPPFNPFHFTGGIIAFTCFNDLVFEGGQIDLVDCGIPFNRKNSLRPLTAQETAGQGQSDNAKLSGQENFITADRFLLNAGDGALMAFARRILFNKDTRLGNPKTHGVRFSRGASDSPTKPSNITNIGGSTLLIAADSITGFNPHFIAKYRNSKLPEGKGLCRCFIASNSILPTDEGLYAFDVLSEVNRVRSLGVEDFGDKSFGNLSNPTLPLNNYAKIVSISRAGHRLSYSFKTFNGLAPLREGSLVLVQVIQKGVAAEAGRITVARVLSDKNNALILDRAAPLVSLDDYLVQVVSIPQFDTLTINSDYNYTRKFNGEIGGVLAVAADTVNLEEGKLNVEGKGGASSYGRAGLNYIGNSQNHNRLPLGAGHGSVFILAKNLNLNENSRIGARYSGLGEGGRLGGNNFSRTNQGGGYSGAPDEDGQGAGGGFLSSESRNFTGYNQGAHLMIIAESILGFSQAAIATGGAGAQGAQNGAASFSGGSNALDRGSDGGFCFIFH